MLPVPVLGSTTQLGLTPSRMGRTSGFKGLCMAAALARWPESWSAVSTGQVEKIKIRRSTHIISTFSFSFQHGYRMTLLTWNDQYRIGPTLIDDEHKSLFQLINDFHTQWAEKHDPATILPILNQLIRYSQKHFRDEEEIMAAAEYPQLEAHKNTHNKLIEEIFVLQQEFESRNVRLEHDLQKFLKHWLFDHVIYCDYEFRDYLAARAK